MILVSGSACIGKSAQLAEVCRQSGRIGVRPVVGLCDPIEQVGPARPSSRLRGPGASRWWPSSSTSRCCDDLQWADRVSRFLIRTLVPRLLGLPVVRLLSGRETAADLLGRDHVPGERTRRFLGASAGNPLLALELLDGPARTAARGDRDTAPGTVQRGHRPTDEGTAGSSA
ncbi:hypothetical protein [Streptomyces sp. STR69]|uniref:hypothetical protein n=1 Tax=Streptomyces sp. STR69 TaxID=1796942 RepID=UPI0021CABBE2|nr:hypothetical protein [Streptomyces sp. STR69]